MGSALTFPKPPGRAAFTAPWFKWFAPNLSLPEGSAFRLEGHTLLMTDEFLAPELVHLMVVIPKNNQKTTWEAAMIVWHLLTIKAPRVYMGAADKDQAREMFGFASHFILSEPELAQHLYVRDSTLEIRRSDGTGSAKVLASDDSKGGGKKQGKNFTMGGIDELHAHENDNLFTDFRSAGFKRRDAAKVAGLDWWHMVGKLATITTAGFDKESALYRELVKFLGNSEKGIAPMGTVQTRMRVLDDGSVVHDPQRGRLTIARYGDGRNVLLHWASEPDDDPEDYEVVKYSNPASTVTTESLKDARESLTPWAYERYRMNRWTLGFESWLPVGSWAALASESVPMVAHRTWEGATTTGERETEGDDKSPPLLRDVVNEHGGVTRAALTDEFREYIASLFPPEASIVGAVDMARYRDTAAVVVIGRNAEGLKVPRTIVWRSGGHNNPIAYEWVKAAVLALHDLYDLQAFGYDPKYWDQSAEEMDALGVMVEQWPQSDERMGPADTELRQEIVSSERFFAHDGDPVLNAHIMAGRAKDVGPLLLRVIQQTGANPPPIDACKALSMANALEKLQDDGEPLGGWG